MSSGIPVLQGLAPAPDLYSRALSAAYRLEFRIIDPDFSQQKEFEVWEKIRRDGKVSQAINQRCAKVAGPHWTIQPGDDTPESATLAGLVEKALNSIKNFREARKLLANGIFRGRAYAYINGRRQLAKLGQPRALPWWLPFRLVNFDKRRVQIVPYHERQADGTERIMKRKELWSPSRNVYEPISADWPMIELVYDDEEGRLGYGRGLIESLYFLWWAKQIILKEGLQGLERWAQGIVVGKINTSRAGKVGKDPESRRTAMTNELAKQRSKHVLVVDRDDEVDVKTGGAEGHQIVRDFLDYMDEAILGVALGSVLPFGSSEDTGSLARSRVEEDTTEDLINFDRGKLDEVLTDKIIIECFLRYNRPILADMGLAEAPPPSFKTTTQKREDPEKNIQVITSALGAGIDLRKDEVYEKIGMTKPDEGDEVFEGREQVDPMMGFGGPGGGESPFAGAGVGQGGKEGKKNGGRHPGAVSDESDSRD
jgi:phage gp29-like protein